MDKSNGCQALNLNTPASARCETTIPGYLAFAIEMEEIFPAISIRNTKKS